MTQPLRILGILGSTADSSFAAQVLEERGDQLHLARDVPDALQELSRDRFDVALVSLSLPRGDGLALVHHLRALYPDLDVLVVAAPTEMEETAHAMALGVLSSVLRPLTGDSLLVAVDRARERRMLVLERARLATEEASSRRRTAIYARCADFVAETDPPAVARRILDACVAEIPCRAASLYVPEVGPDAAAIRIAFVGSGDALPDRILAEELDGIDPSVSVEVREGRVRIALLGDRDLHGIVDLVPEARDDLPGATQEALEVIAALGTAALAAARRVDGIARTGIKDPETSAYTFAYFGDVAGREIDRAGRHGRRFSLLLISLDGFEALRRSLPLDALVELRRGVADSILDAVRDSDVLARVEDDEFYLLLPETGLLGALACRRRIERRFAEMPGLREPLPGVSLRPAVGIAVYPTDGGDLGRLLRMGRRRAERTQHSVWRRLGLSGRPLWEAIDELLGRTNISPDVGERLSIDPHLVRAHDHLGLARHAVLPAESVARFGAALVRDAVRHRLGGCLYVAGDDTLAAAVASALDVHPPPRLRAWILGSESGPGGRIRLPIDDPRLLDRTLLLGITDVGGYALLARRVADGTALVYHASDLDVVDGLVTALQAAYYLQPEVVA